MSSMPPGGLSQQLRDTQANVNAALSDLIYRGLQLLVQHW